MERRKIIKVGGSLAVTLPKEFIRRSGWKNGQAVIVDRDHDSEVLILRLNRKSKVTIELVLWAEQLIDRYREAFEELAKR